MQLLNFGGQHEISGQALTDYVIRAFHKRIYNASHGGDPSYLLEDDKEVEWSDRGGESEDEDGDSDLADE